LDVCVVVPVRNDAVNLKRLLESLHRQCLAFDLVVVDNGSTDATPDVAKSLCDKVLYYPALRVGALRNRGVLSAEGEYIAFVDSDHEVPEDWIESGTRALELSPEVVAVGAPCLPPTDGTWVQSVWSIHRLRGPNREEVAWLGAGNLFVRRSAFLEVGGFSEDLIASEDVDLCYRLKERGGKIFLDKTIRNIHHGEPKTVLQFLRKEYWRGSSSLKAWFSQGCPSRDIPNLLWPIWFGGLGGVYVVCLVVVAVLSLSGTSPDNSMPALSPICLVIYPPVWWLPAILLAVKVCWGERKMHAVLQLAILYALFGIARFAAMVRSK
jgi:glycosyltransferase involved in cell wall biosynthesis